MGKREKGGGLWILISLSLFFGKAPLYMPSHRFTAYRLDPSSQSPQPLHHSLDAVHVPAVQTLHDLLGLAFLEVQEALDEFAVDETEGFVGVADLVAKGAVGRKGDVARGREERAERVLEVDEERLGCGREEGEKINRSFDLGIGLGG